jgi:hypothetical protein
MDKKNEMTSGLGLARGQLMELAERYYRQAKEQELQSLLPDRAAKPTAAQPFPLHV